MVDIRKSKALRSVLLKFQGLFPCYPPVLVCSLEGVEKGDYLYSVRYPSHLVIQYPNEGPQNAFAD